MYTEGAGPLCKCTGQCTMEGSVQGRGYILGVQILTAAKFPEASFPTANLFMANFPRTGNDKAIHAFYPESFSYCGIHAYCTMQCSEFVWLLLYQLICLITSSVMHLHLIPRKSLQLCK